MSLVITAMTVQHKILGPLLPTPAIERSRFEATKVFRGDARRAMIWDARALFTGCDPWEVCDGIAYGGERASFITVCRLRQFRLGKPAGNYDPTTARLWNSKKLCIDDVFAHFVAKALEASNEAAIGAIAGKSHDTRHIFYDYKSGEEFTDKPSEVRKKCFVPHIYFAPLLTERLAWGTTGENEFIFGNPTDIAL